MSGGSYDYFYSRVEEIANRIEAKTTARRAFAAHLRLVAQALHDIEWVDSSDYAPGDEDAAILRVVGPAAILRTAVEDAERARAELDAAIEGARKAVTP